MRYYLLIIHGDVEPEVRGPFKSDAGAVRAARKHRRKYGDEDGLYAVQARNKPRIEAYCSSDFDNI